MAYRADFYRGVMSFFFQAEDGIRDLVRSRGLGDVYKRQRLVRAWRSLGAHVDHLVFDLPPTSPGLGMDHSWPVSYTHLTLPTSDLV